MTDGEVVDEIQTDVDPGGIAVDEDALWVANNGSDTVSRIEDPDRRAPEHSRGR